MIQRFTHTLPGIAVAACVATLAFFIQPSTPLISSSVWALLIGLALHQLIVRYPITQKGLTFTSKKLLRLAIIGMGVTLNITEVLSIGGISLIVMIFTLITAFGGGYLLGKIIGLDWKQSALISAGTGICGGSAIGALAPVIEADESAIAWALSATFIFDILMVILFPIMGRFLAMSDLGYGLWTGTAVNDTSSVVAAGYAFSERAGAFALVVKLTRTLSIIPISLIFAFIQGRNTAKANRVSVLQLLPWFIIVFLVVVGLNSFSLIPHYLSNIIAKGGRFAMVMALGAIGLSTDAKTMAKSATKPMTHGFLISLAVVLVSYAVQHLLGQL